MHKIVVSGENEKVMRALVLIQMNCSKPSILKSILTTIGNLPNSLSLKSDINYLTNSSIIAFHLINKTDVKIWMASSNWFFFDTTDSTFPCFIMLVAFTDRSTPVNWFPFVICFAWSSLRIQLVVASVLSKSQWDFPEGISECSRCDCSASF